MAKSGLIGYVTVWVKKGERAEALRVAKKRYKKQWVVSRVVPWEGSNHKFSVYGHLR